VRFSERVVDLRNARNDLIVAIKAEEKAHWIKHVAKVSRHGNQRDSPRTFAVSMALKERFDLGSKRLRAGQVII
jgi:hypothetical protein